MHVFLEENLTSIFYKPESNTPPVVDQENEQLNILVEMVMRLQEENKRLTDRLHELEVENENYKIRYG